MKSQNESFDLLIRYLIVGGLTKAIDICAFLFGQSNSDSVVVNNAIAASISLTFNFTMHRLFSFKIAGQNLGPVFLKYLAINLLLFIVDTLFITFQIQTMQLSDALAKSISTVLLTIAAFYLARNFVFKLKS